MVSALLFACSQVSIHGGGIKKIIEHTEMRLAMSNSAQDILSKAYSLRNQIRNINFNIQQMEAEREQVEHEIDRLMGEWRLMVRQNNL